jgi:hypothetical protein
MAGSVRTGSTGNVSESNENAEPPQSAESPIPLCLHVIPVARCRCCAGVRLMSRILFILLGAILISAGGYQRPSSAAGPVASTPSPIAVANMVDVTVRGKRYYGMHFDYKLNGRIVSGSCVLLMPWDERPKAGIHLESDVSVITINDRRYEVKGHHVCEVDGRGTKLTIYLGEIPFDDYVDKPTLERRVRAIMAEEGAGS